MSRVGHLHLSPRFDSQEPSFATHASVTPLTARGHAEAYRHRPRGAGNLTEIPGGVTKRGPVLPPPGATGRHGSPRDTHRPPSPAPRARGLGVGVGGAHANAPLPHRCRRSLPSSSWHTAGSVGLTAATPPPPPPLPVCSVSGHGDSRAVGDEAQWRPPLRMQRTSGRRRWQPRPSSSPAPLRALVRPLLARLAALRGSRELRAG